MKSALIIISMCILVSCRDTEVAHTADHTGTDSTHIMGPNTLHLSNQQVQLGNITVDSVKEHTLGDEILLTGVVNVNQRTAVSVAARVMGRVERLSYKTTGNVISKGEPLYEIYSEDLNMAIKELQLLYEKNRTLQNAQIDLEQLLQSARTKLKLYGLTEDQVKSYEALKEAPVTVKVMSPSSGVITSVDVKEGDYVMEGAPIYHLADYSSLWIEGQVYADYLNLVKEGMPAKISFPGFPESSFTGSISFINPELNTASKINLVRIEIPNKKELLKPGLQAYINVLSSEIRTLSVPTGAVIMNGQGSTVWIQTGENMFESRMVRTGLESNGFTEIKHGLEKGEKVVVTGAYLLNSEFIFKRGATPMEGHQH